MNLPYQSTKNYISVGRNRRLRFRSTRPFIIQKKKKKTIKNKLKNKWVITQTRENNLLQKKGELSHRSVDVLSCKHTILD